MPRFIYKIGYIDDTWVILVSNTTRKKEKWVVQEETTTEHKADELVDYYTTEWPDEKCIWNKEQ